MGKGPNWGKDEDAILLKAIADGVSPDGAAELLKGRNPKACQTHAHVLGHPFPRQPRVRKPRAKMAYVPRTSILIFEPYAKRSARSKAERAKIKAEARRMNIDLALPWPVVVQAVRERLSA